MEKYDGSAGISNPDSQKESYQPKDNILLERIMNQAERTDIDDAHSDRPYVWIAERADKKA